MWVPGLAAALAVVALAAGWRGVDWAAAVHRVQEFRAHGWVLWDGSWYGGQWTLDYSVVFAALAATVGLPVVAVGAATVATAAFGRLAAAVPGAGRPAVTAAGVVFAAGTLPAVAIGQIPFLAGGAAGLAAVALAVARRWWAAWPTALAAGALSPLAGLFVAVAAAGWTLAAHRDGPAAAGRRLGLGAAGLATTVATALVFPGEGRMPFDGTDCCWYLAVGAAVLAITPRRARVLRAGIVVYLVAVAVCWAVPSPVGGNVGRAEDTLALPLAAAALWGRPPRWRAALAPLAVPLALSAWAPAAGALTSLPAAAADHAGFYAPLDRWLAGADPGGLGGRVEVVGTYAHWESVWVADTVPLARGWERQSDVTLNPIFYRPGPIGAAAYRAWLLDNGVRFVALPAARLDEASVVEAALLRAGVPGLTPVWSDTDWQVWSVPGATLASPGATVTALGAASVSLRTTGPGTYTVRVRANRWWRVTAGRACVGATGPGGSWLRVRTPAAGRVTLAVRLGGPHPGCG